MVEYVSPVVPFIRGRGSFAPYHPYKEERQLSLSLETPDGMRTSRPPDAPAEQGQTESPEAREAARNIAKALKQQHAVAEQKDRASEQSIVDRMEDQFNAGSPDVSDLPTDLYEVSDEKTDRHIRYTNMSPAELHKEGLSLASAISYHEAQIALFEARIPFLSRNLEDTGKSRARITELKEELRIIYTLCDNYEDMTVDRLMTNRMYNLNKKELLEVEARRFVDNLEYGMKLKEVQESDVRKFIDPKISNARNELRVIEARLKLIDEELAKRRG